MEQRKSDAKTISDSRAILYNRALSNDIIVEKLRFIISELSDDELNVEGDSKLLENQVDNEEKD